jgi:hypothetical protein
MPPASRAALVALAALLVATSASAERPNGAYSIDLTGQARVRFISGGFVCTEAEIATILGCMDSALAIDERGAITGTGRYRRDRPGVNEFAYDLHLALRGQMSGFGVDPFARFTASAEGILRGPGATQPVTLDVAGSGRMDCSHTGVVGDDFSCVALLPYCAFQSGRKVDCDSLRISVRVKGVFVPVEIDLQLATDAKRHVTGSATLGLGAGFAIPCQVVGRYSPDLVTMRATNREAKARVSFHRFELENGAQTRGKLSYRLLGMKGNVLFIGPPPPPPPPDPEPEP